MTSIDANSDSAASGSGSSSISVSASTSDSLLLDSGPSSHTTADHAPLCRVCRSDDPSLGPLFHPCRCTGSIAHVHQDCLSTWLAHSKKTSCELCAHAFSFEKVYKPGSPARPPLHTIAIQAFKELVRLIVLLARATLVAICWLALVPWTVVSVSSAYWNLSDWFAFGLTSNPEPRSSPVNITQLAANLTDINNNFVWIIHLDPNTIALDIFQGQLITCAVILTFVVVFLLREWILQNTPPQDVIQLVEDEEPAARADDLQVEPPFEPAEVHQVEEPLVEEENLASVPLEIDPIPLDSSALFSHHILVTAAYMLLISDPTPTTPFLAPKPPPGPSPAGLIDTWNQLATALTTSSTSLPLPMTRLRAHVLERAEPETDEEDITFSTLEREWTHAIVRDLRLLKHLQSIYHCTHITNKSHGLIYSLLTLIMLLESQERVSEGPDAALTLKLFIAPLVSIGPSQSRLERSIRTLAQTYSSGASGVEGREKMRRAVVKILVEARLLGTLVRSEGFVRYAHAMMYDEELFVKKADEPVTSEAIQHRLLVTALYRLSSPPPSSLPALEKPEIEPKTLELWSTFVSAPKDSFESFRVHLDRKQVDEKFEKLEKGWLVKALQDETIAEFTCSITTGLLHELVVAFRKEDPEGARVGLEGQLNLTKAEGKDLDKPIIDATQEMLSGSELLTKEAILSVLVRDRLLDRILTDERFIGYATAMFAAERLFEHQQILAKLEVVDINMDKGKQKAVTEQAQVAQPGPSTSLERSSHIDAFNWLEVADELPKPAVDGPTAPIEIPAPRAMAPPRPPNVPPNRRILPAPVAREIPPVPGFDRAFFQARIDQFERDDRRRAREEEAAAAPPEEELMAEDLDGILELIGMKGSLWMLAQNVGLMTMLLSLSILAFVHLPHVIGKIAVLSRAHRLLIPPLKGLLVLRRLVHRLLDYTSVHLKRHLPQEKLQKLLPLLRPLPAGPRSLLERGVTFGSELRARAEPIWVSLVEGLSACAERIGYGSKPLDRALAVLLGYTELILLSILYLSSGLDHQRARFVSQTMVEGIRQQLLIAKVGTFIFVELVIFPFLCGLLLTFTSLPMFAGSSVGMALDRFSSAPYSTTLLTWLAGTCFMFLFAILVSTCRESLRPGVCWWLRDPSDAQFNPIQEIVSRPTISQLKKIAASAIMYGTVILLGLGAVISGLEVLAGALPLRLHLDRPLSDAALDLVAYHTLLPLLLHILDPRAVLKRALQRLSRSLAAKLRLSCFLYGQRTLEEETTLEVIVRQPGQPPSVRQRSLWPTSLDEQQEEGMVSGMTIERRRKPAGGSFARVPATDSVKVVPGRKMHIPVRSNGIPIDPYDGLIIAQQAAEGGSSHYTIVYLPPLFGLRLIAYVSGMWLSGVGIAITIIGVPLMIGRLIFDRILSPYGPEPHDTYAYFLGTIICAIIFGLTNTSKRRTSIMEIIQIIIFGIGIGLILPLLATATIELYIVGPMKTRKPGIETIYLIESWAYGVLYVSIASRVIRVVPNWVSRAQDEVIEHWNSGRYIESIKQANKKLIIPIILRLSIALSLPISIMIPILTFLPNEFIKKIGWTKSEIIKSAYPIALSWYSHYLTSKICARGIKRWMERVRDESFLEERRLKNYEPVKGDQRSSS
ncbi:hypothetical protein CROQUDRAFT_661474 [Cronartium quercuum f. sp. fusiforme G11]|uniref:RING-type E3 ubiquitin transferase n=1 Tax=Cronartium quercuum f. sp. fusiforme G11 TaxID=708437 RepID=A0A9P6NAZ0_9BASI|nr:hypothetical protein CROQUDRAFT_661474 [Cronartium quercuum f. sp. fusiforme G11]